MKVKITYAQLQERVALAAGITRQETQTLLKEMTAAIVNGLVTEGKVNLAGLGRFGRKIQKARKGRNPQTGEPLDIPEKNRVDFLPEAQWRQFINREFEQLPAVPEPSQPSTEAQKPAAAAPDRHPRQPAPPPPSVTAKSLPQTALLRRTEPETPDQPVEIETAAPAISPPAAPAEETVPKRRNPFAPALGVILLVAALLFFLWPRPQHPTITETPRPETTRIAAGKPLLPPETRPSEPDRTAGMETTVVATLPAPEPAAEDTPAAPPVVLSIQPAPVSRHVVTAGDSLWKISDQIYHYPYFWPIIFQENRGMLQHPDALVIGLQLAIPAFEGRVGHLTESDFQQLADGYLGVYQAYQRQRHPRAPYYLWVAYRLRAHWVPEADLMTGEPEDIQFVLQLKGRGLIH